MAAFYGCATRFVAPAETAFPREASERGAAADEMGRRRARPPRRSIYSQGHTAPRQCADVARTRYTITSSPYRTLAIYARVLMLRFVQ